MAAENFRSLSNIAPLIIVGNLEFAVKRNVISRRFVILMVMVLFFFSFVALRIEIWRVSLIN